MFYRVTEYNFDADRFEDVLAWGESVRSQIEAISGMIHVDTYRSEPGKGIIVAAYESEDAYQAAADTVASILGDMGQFMTSPPTTHSGTVDMSFGR